MGADVGGIDGRVGGGYIVGTSGDDVGDRNCMGGVGVVVAGDTNGANGAKCWDCMGGDVGFSCMGGDIVGADGRVGCSFWCGDIGGGDGRVGCSCLGVGGQVCMHDGVWICGLGGKGVWAEYGLCF